MQELQNWFRIFCTSNGLQFTLWPSQLVAEPVRGLHGQSCELKTVRDRKNPKPVLKFLQNKYSFLRVSPESEIQCPPLVKNLYFLSFEFSQFISDEEFSCFITRLSKETTKVFQLLQTSYPHNFIFSSIQILEIEQKQVFKVHSLQPLM